MTDRLNFSSGIAYKRPSKRVPEKYLESPLRPQFDISEGMRPPVVLIPHRSLPVKFKDKTTEQWIVIPKGRLVSAMTVLNSAAEVFTGAFDNDGNAIKVSPDSSYAGISRNTIGLLVPANGGVQTDLYYSADDVLAEVPASSGDILVVDGGYIAMEANAPIGAVFMDIYQDIRGAYHNYDTHKNYAVVAENTVQMPFCDSELAASMSGLEVDKFLPKGFVHSETGSVTSIADSAANSGTHSDIEIAAHGLSVGDAVTLAGVTGTNAVNYNTALTITHLIDEDNFSVAVVWTDEDGSAATYTSGVAATATGAGYAAGEKYFTSLTIDSTFASHGKSGTFVKADMFGNYVPQYSAYTSDYRTQQTAGRILGLDARFPKDLLETVEAQRFESSPLARVAGAATEGLSEHLFYFVYHVLTGAGYVWPTDGTDPAKKVKEFVEAGAFGMALIQLSIR